MRMDTIGLSEANFEDRSFLWQKLKLIDTVNSKVRKSYHGELWR